MMCDLERFELEYLRRRSKFETAARSLEEYISLSLSEARTLFHNVTFRVKSIDSARRKIVSKGYDAPWEQLMDLIAGRVFTYLKEDSPLIEDVIRRHFAVDDEKSINKADDLQHNAFGYTSRHLICQASSFTQDLKLRTSLGSARFEIQIRTVLEHGWAEVEHELVYKARTKTPDLIRRRFAASAASLELIEHEFARLRQFESEIIVTRTPQVPASSSMELDRAWLIASLAYAFPGKETWSPNPHLDNFYRGNEITILNFLLENGVTDVGRWVNLLTASRTQSRIAAYAHQRGLAPALVNHLPIAVVACAELSSEMASVAFEHFLDDALRQILLAH